MEAKAFLYIDRIKFPLSYEVTDFIVEENNINLKFNTNDNGIFKVLKEISKNNFYDIYSLEVIYKDIKYLFTPIWVLDYDVLRILPNGGCEAIVSFKYLNNDRVR